MNATATRTRRQLKPVHGTVRVLQPIGSINPQGGEVAISGKRYLLKRHENGFTLYGWNEREKEVTVYDLPTDLNSCDCPDAVYNAHRREDGRCKHQKGLAALIAAGKI